MPSNMKVLVATFADEHGNLFAGEIVESTTIIAADKETVAVAFDAEVVKAITVLTFDEHEVYLNAVPVANVRAITEVFV